MPAPSSALSSQRPDLAGSLMEFNLDMAAQGFIANRVLPVVDVAKQAGNFGVIPIEQLLKEAATERAPGAGYSRNEYSFTPTTYATVEHGHEEPVDDREATMYSEYFDAELLANMRARATVMRNYEKRAAALLFNATTWTATTITHEWDDYANAVPTTDVEGVVQTVAAACGVWPNALIINRNVFRNLRNCAQIVDRIKYWGGVNPAAGEITPQVLAAAFDLEEVIVAGSWKNTAIEGQDISLSQIWSDEYAMVAKVARTADIREPCVGRTFHWGEDGSEMGTLVEDYRDETVRSNIIRARMDTDELVLYTEAAGLFDNVTT